jgi:oxygen-independent coproporphyrinogen-3 oxidase
MEQFVQVLKQEILMYAEYGAKEKFETIFFGGGTPSLLSVIQLSDILHTLHTTFDITDDAEITVEANPGTVDKNKLTEYKAMGINRLSFGIQSFHDDELQFLGRIHNAKDAVQSVRDAQTVGFENISIDLIYSLPSQTMMKWQETVTQAVALGTQHISAYSLIVEDGTPLAAMVKSKMISPLPTEVEADMYEATMEFLLDTGFEHYEVSNYAKRGFASRHNSNYWNHSNYLSFGPSAHSFWSDQRWWNIAHLRTYVEKVSSGQLPIAGKEQLGCSQLFDELVMLGLRSKGISLPFIKEKTGIDFISHTRELTKEFVDRGLVVLEDSTLRLTDKGFLLCDEISEQLLRRCIPA